VLLCGRGFCPALLMLVVWRGQKLKGEGVPISCISFSRMEVVGGLMNGWVLLWWIKTGEIMKRIKVSR
jgi:hypothetical protein